MKNTLGISLYSFDRRFPLPIILALALNEIKDGPFKNYPDSHVCPKLYRSSGNGRNGYCISVSFHWDHQSLSRFYRRGKNQFYD